MKCIQIQTFTSKLFTLISLCDIQPEFRTHDNAIDTMNPKRLQQIINKRKSDDGVVTVRAK